ncbi:MAG TPA: tRNA preQ1(34) S-adenosylmethionine ribosyltransferase-isomerase QueA [Clostridiales bacterium]|nr:tRNA preQ1(34) S-adenosylmethionine ribosyltransferase-isomerase QueA [Clostridiales bacterium]
MNKSDFYYELPPELIAQTPVYPRDSSRLLVYERAKDNTTHTIFKNIGDFLKSGDVLVINNTKVIPARLLGFKSTGAKAEVLLLKRLNLTDWEVLLKPAKRLKLGAVIVFSEKLKCRVLSEGEGVWVVRFEFSGVFEQILDELGQMPLPPYIRQKLIDKSRYNTVYAKIEGSSAAPTAGLHFTPELIQSLKDKGIIFAEVLLNVGLGTFLPVKTANIEDHRMHSEYYEISQAAADTINLAKAQKRRIIAVGTTSVRVLESSANNDGRIRSGSGDTDIFIYPGYNFKVIDGLITNFHLPESTLIMLVSAFMGREKVLDLYRQAIDLKYRFFSFGDAMFIV